MTETFKYSEQTQASWQRRQNNLHNRTYQAFATKYPRLFASTYSTINKATYKHIETPLNNHCSNL